MKNRFDDEEFDIEEFEKLEDFEEQDDSEYDDYYEESDIDKNEKNERKQKNVEIPVKMAVTGAIFLAFIIGGLVIALALKGGNSEENEDDMFASIEISQEAIPSEDVSSIEISDNAVADNSDESDADNTSDEAGKEKSVEASSSASLAEAAGDADPEANAKQASGAEVDVAALVNASNVGENSNVTYGIDVSRFQGTINWEQVAGSGIDFAMIRVGYRDSKTGEIKADTNAKYNMQEAEKYGIKIGAYFFSTAISKDEAVEEANWVTNNIKQYPITYPVGFNCEGFDRESSRQYNLTKDDRSSIAGAFLDQIYGAGYTPIFYASQGELLGDAKWNTSQLQQKYKIWMAWYGQDTSAIASGPSYNGQCAMWQYTNKGTVPGISGTVDVDVAYFGYNGTETAKDTSERETASADVEALMKFNPVDETVTAKSSTNLRNKPSQGSDSTVMVTLENGQTAQRTGVSDSGWSRVVYNGATYYAVSSYLTTDLSAPKQEVKQEVVDNSGFKTKFTDCNDIVTAKEVVNLRNKPSVTDEDSQVIATLYAGDTAVRTGVNAEYGWSRVEYNGQTLYCVSSYLRTVE